MTHPVEKLRRLARRTLGWWLLPIVIFAVLTALVLLGDRAPLRFLVYTVL